ncbi:MAG: hypothetical protein BGO51_22525 [Rhodospirillales bacterium 69-11]|nr:hypothetical protein [Rhodospirillales bacterium]OJW31304.1 MAG: hypothetical protein BGO51_22525 [Rhodospirillales bacterium 69-11]
MFDINSPKHARVLPTGLAFDLPDLFMAQGWAEFHGLRLVVELDGCTDGEEYEEVLAFYPPNSAFRRWMMWRSAKGIVVQPMMGRTRRFDSVAEALEHLIPASA